MRFATTQGFNTADHFSDYLIDAFDTLYSEGDASQKLMSVGLHCRLVGRPARFKGLVKFLDHILSCEKVWIAKRIDIASHWIEKFPYQSFENSK